MRIAHLLKHSRKGDAHVESVVDLACQQARLGHEVLFVAGVGHFRQLLARHGVTFIEVPGDSGWQTLPMLRDITYVLRRIRPDIVHAHMAAGACLAWLLRPLGGYRLVTTPHTMPGSRSRLMGLGDRVIALSDAQRREMREQGIASHKLRVVHTSIEADGAVEQMARATIAVYREARAQGAWAKKHAVPQEALPQ